MGDQRGVPVAASTRREKAAKPMSSFIARLQTLGASVLVCIGQAIYLLDLFNGSAIPRGRWLATAKRRPMQA